jgi:hypothetical protein
MTAGAGEMVSGPLVPRRRRRWPRRVRWVLGVLFFAALAWVFWPVGSVPLAVSPQTTVVTGPMNADGTVNYVAALNAAASEGVTADNNAAIPIIQAFGPKLLMPLTLEDALGRASTVSVPPEVDGALRELGMSPLPLVGPYFVSLDDYVAERLGEFASADSTEALRADWLAVRIMDEAGGTISPRIRAFLVEWLRINEQPLARIQEASHKPRYFVPMARAKSPQFLVEICPGARLRAIGRAVYLRSMLRIADGDLEGAWRDSLLAHRLGQLYVQQPTLIEHLVGLAVSSMADDTGCRIASDPALNERQARAMLAELRRLPEPPSAVTAIDGAERYMVLDALMNLQRAGGLPAGPQGGSIRVPGFLINVNVMLGEANAAYDRLVAAFRVSDPVQRRAAITAAEDANRRAVEARTGSLGSVGGWCSLLVLPPRARSDELSRRLGNFLLSILLPSIGKVDELRTHALMHRRLEELAFALAIWRAEKGSYPEALSALSPDYVVDVPIDYFTGQPLRYLPGQSGYVLYSLGPNGVDDGGLESSDENPSADDIVVRVADVREVPASQP